MNKKISALIILYIFLQFSPLAAQNNVNGKNYGKIFLSDAKHFFDVGVGLVTAPCSFSASDWYTTGGTIGGTALLFTADKNIQSFARNNQSSFNDALFSIDKFYGSPYTAILTGAIYGYGFFAENEDMRILGLKTSEALIYSTIITGVLKISFGRKRPYAGNDNMFFKPFQFSNDRYQSLPSGHTTAAFAVSTVMANYTDKIYWKVFWYSAAGLVGAARIYHDKHWASDVFLGAAIGYFVGEFISDFNNGRTDVFGIKYSPLITLNSIGINLKF
jgi:membrane-associated phospholipid phosphatase